MFVDFYNILQNEIINRYCSVAQEQILITIMILKRGRRSNLINDKEHLLSFWPSQKQVKIPFNLHKLD